MMSEEEEQKTLMRWATIARGKYPELKYLFHIPNERKCSPKEGARLKLMGVRSGVPDLFLPVSNGTYHGLWIEMKSKSKSATASGTQLEWLAALSILGYKTHLCKGWEEARDAILAYVGGKP